MLPPQQSFMNHNYLVVTYCKRVNTMSMLNQSGEEQMECPLCMEPLEVDDLNFFPCTCGYQICRFCWHRIRTDENGLCPACRKAYPENPADFKPLSQEEVARLKAEKRHKDQQRKQKITENRKHLANVRVVQQNLVFVVGLPVRLADAEVLKKHEYFGKFGKIVKVVINQSTSYAGSQGPSASAYVTYHKADDALRAIQAVNNISVDGRTIKTSLGTTKYCSHFMKNQTCPKPDCMYLHELGNGEASFTKEEMQQGKHQDYEKKLHEHLLNMYNHRERKPTSPPSSTASVTSYQGNNSITSSSSISCISSSTTSSGKEGWPSIQPGITTNNSGNIFGLSLGGNGNINTSDISNNVKAGNIRNERFDQQTTKVTTNSHNKRHTSREENIGKVNDKLQDTIQDALQAKMDHSKSNSRLMSCKDSLSTQELNQNVQNSNNFGGSSSESSGPSTEVDSDFHESDENLADAENGNKSATHILPANHRATFFEPDNNSFFSTNNFMKVAASASGSATNEWSVNGLALTHMPDVLPSVHSSEDWQAAFGFSNSENSQNLPQQQNKCVIPTDSRQNEDIERSCGCSEEQSQSLETSCENKQLLVNSVGTTLHHCAASHLNVNSGHLPEKVSAHNCYLPESVSSANVGRDSIPVNPAFSSSSQQVFAHPSFVRQDGTILMMHHHHHYHHHFPVNFLNNIAVSRHLIANSLPTSQSPSKFVTDIHLRRNLIKHLNVHNVENEHLSGGNANNLNVPSVSGRYNVTKSEKLQNGNNSDSQLVIFDENKYIRGFLDYRQNPVEPNTDLEYDNVSENSEHYINTVLENEEEISSNDCGRLTDDELGFDPFHETQKGLAEMMEKENTILVVHEQQNKLQSPHSLLNASHLHNHHGSFNSLTQHVYQQYQLNHMNHVKSKVPHSAEFDGSKHFGPFISCSQHILSQQNHRLPTSVSGCENLLDGLGHRPSNATQMGPSAHTRTRLPPPGFTTAPNHMNAFGLGIPRAPSNNSSKILPFMGLGNSCNSSNNSSSPVTQSNVTLASMTSRQGTNQQSAMSCSSQDAADGHIFAQENDINVPKVVGDMNAKDWTENLRLSLPNLNNESQNQTLQFAGTKTTLPPSGTLNTFFGGPHSSLHINTQKGWIAEGCTDLTCLDPAVVSSFHAAHPGFHVLHSANSVLQQYPHQSSTHLHHLQQNNLGHWTRSQSLEENDCLFYGSNDTGTASVEWSSNMIAQQEPNAGSVTMTPPPGFSSMRLADLQQGTVVQKDQNSLAAEMGKIESASQSGEGLLHTKEEDRLEYLR